MINKKVLDFLKEKGYADRLTEHKETIDTVEHAAQQLGCSESEIAKTLSFIVDKKPVIVVMAGDGRVNYSKFKAMFHAKPSMIQRDQVEAITGSTITSKAMANGCNAAILYFQSELQGGAE